MLVKKSCRRVIATLLAKRLSQMASTVDLNEIDDAVVDLYVTQGLSLSDVISGLRQQGFAISNHKLRAYLREHGLTRSLGETMQLVLKNTDYTKRSYVDRTCKACGCEFSPKMHNVLTCYTCCPTALDRQRWRYYQITKPMYDALWNRSGGACEACCVPLEKSKACIDHDHQTRQVRGILCHACNLALGHFEKHRDAFMRYLNRDGIE